MKVLFANDKGGYFAGVEQVIVNTAHGLKDRGHSCYLAYGEPERDMAEYSQAFEKVFCCRDLGPAGGDIEFEQALKQVGPDAVYFHKLARLPQMLSAWPKGVRTVRMVHDHDLYCPTGYKYYRKSGRVCHRRAGWRCWADLAFLEKDPDSALGLSWVSITDKIGEMRRSHRLDAILGVSSFIRDGLIQNGFPPERVHVLNPILCMEDLPPSPVPRQPNILFVGQVIRGKGADLLVRALKLVQCDFKLDIVGTGNGADKVKRLCRDLGLEQKVHFHDWVPHAQVSGFYQAARVVAAPSRWPEPFTLVGQESMRHSRPVVAFDVGGNSNWLEPDLTGLLVPEQDIPAYARALEQVLTDEELAARLGAGAYRRVRERFSFEEYLDKVEQYLGAA